MPVPRLPRFFDGNGMHIAYSSLEPSYEVSDLMIEVHNICTTGTATCSLSKIRAIVYTVKNVTHGLKTTQRHPFKAHFADHPEFVNVHCLSATEEQRRGIGTSYDELWNLIRTDTGTILSCTNVDAGRELWEACLLPSSSPGAVGEELACLHVRSCPYRRPNSGRAPKDRYALTGPQSRKLIETTTLRQDRESGAHGHANEQDLNEIRLMVRAALQQLCSLELMNLTLCNARLYLRYCREPFRAIIPQAT